MVRVIYLGLFFWYEEFSHSTDIPLSFRFLTNSPHSPFIPLSFPSFGFPSFPLSFPYHSPVHSISPHSPLIPLSFGFPSFPCHSLHSVSQISPSFPWVSPHSVSPPAYPVLSRLFSCGYSLSALFLFPCSLSVLSRHSPVL